MRFSIREIAKSASRALVAIYSKLLCARCFSLPVYSKLIETIVEPVLFFCSGIRGHTKHDETEFLIKLADIFSVLPSTVPMFPRRVTWAGILANK